MGGSAPPWTPRTTGDSGRVPSDVAGWRADGADRLEVGEVGVDDVDDIDVVEDLDPRPIGLAEQVADERVLLDAHRIADVLTPVDHVLRLQALGVQPAHVE